MKFTRYFTEKVLPERQYISLLWCQRAIISPVRRIIQHDGRIRHWIFIVEEQKYFRVVTLPDGETIHNAFFDRRFKEDKL